MTNDRTISINLRALGFNTYESQVRSSTAATKTWAAETEAAVGKVEQSTERISRLWKAAFEAFLGFEAIDFLKKLAEGAAAAADQLEIAARVAQNFGHSLNVADMESWLRRLAASAEGGGYAISDMRAAIQQFAEVGATGAQSQRLLVDAIGLAAAKHIDLGQAVHIAQMAVQGHYELLSRYGILTEEQAKKVTNLSQVMELWEKNVAGAAEERARGLEGAFGRLTSAISLLANSVGRGLTPFFNEVATVLTNFTNLLNRIPDPVMATIATFAALAVSLIAVTLVLPAITKGIEIVGEGFSLLSALASPLLTALGRIATTVGLTSGSFEALSLAELEGLAPMAAIVLAIVGVVVALTELVRHLDHVKDAWHDWTQYMGDAFAEFVNNFKRDHTVLLQLIGAIGQAFQNPAAAGEILGRTLALNAPNAKIKYGGKLDSDASTIGKDIVADWSSVWKSITGFFSSSLGSIGKPGASLDGLGGSKDGGAGGQKAINDAITSAKAVIDAASAAATQAVDRARARLDQAKAALDLFKAQHEGEKLTPALGSQEQALINAALAKEQALRDALNHQQAVETQNYERLTKLAAALPASDKERVSHAAELNKAADEHRTKAIQIRTAWENVVAEIAKLIGEFKKIPMDVAAQGVADAMRDLQSAHEQTAGALRQQADDVAFHQHLAGLTGASPDAMNALNVQAAELARQIAEDNLAFIQHELALDRSAESAKQRESEIADLTKQRVTAEDALNKATNDYLQTVNEANRAHTAWLQQLASQVPGLGVKYNESGQFAGLSLNPMEILLQAVEKSKAFADIMQVVNAIMGVFSQIIDALRPVIDALLQVVLGVTKVFIGLWNTVARILSLLGIHIQMLQLENQQLQTNAPLLKIWHDLPTLKEAGGTAPLTLTAIEDAYRNNITNPLQNALKDQSLGGGLFGVLGEILGVLVIVKTLMALMTGSTGGGILGNIAGSILKIFGGGGSGAAGAGEAAASGAGEGAESWGDAATSTLDPANMSSSVEQGVSGAFAHGSALTFSAIASAISGAFEGIALGQTFAKAFGTDSPVWGEALGAAGGIVGGLLGGSLLAGLGLGMAAGPIGALAGAAIGALIGGMIGPHWGPASNYPDRSDPAVGRWDYRTFVADYTGHSGSFDGHTVAPQGPFNAAAGGTPMTFMLEQWLRGANFKALPAALQGVYTQLKALGGSRADLGIKSEYNGIFTLNSGAHVAVQTFMQLINQAFGALQNPLDAVGGSLASVATRLQGAKDSLNELSTAATLAGGNIKRYTNPSSPGGGPPATVHPGAVQIQLTTGPVNGYQGVDDLAQDLALATERAFANRRFLLSGAAQT